MNKILLITIALLLLVSVQGLRVKQEITGTCVEPGMDPALDSGLNITVDTCTSDTYDHDYYGFPCTVDSTYCDQSSTYNEYCEDGSYS